MAIKSELSKKTTSAAMEAREKKAIKHTGSRNDEWQ